VDPGTPGEPVEPPPSLEHALQVAREHRPLLGALEAQVRAAEEGIRVAGAGFWPRFSVQGGYDRNSPTMDPFFTDPSRQNTIYGSVNVSWNLFAGFTTSAQVREAKHAFARARLSLEQGKLEVAAEVKQALDVLAVQAEVAQVTRENLALAEEALRLAEERFAAGVSTSLELRDAQLKLTDAELSLIGSRVDVEIARAALERAMGMPGR